MNFRGYLRYLSISLLFYCLLFVVLITILVFHEKIALLKESNLLRFDSLLYQEIKIHGYNKEWLCAFFPAFPFTWNFLNCSPLDISILNSILFIISISTLAYLYKMELKIQIFFLTIPSMIFMFVPYSEAFFFAIVTLIVIGLKLGKLNLILFGLFIVSLIRPTTFVFVPAIIGAFFISEKDTQNALKKSLLATLFLTLGLFTTIYIHFQYTSKWFVFFEAQKLWENYLHMPTLPLRSWGGDACARFDGSIMIIFLISIGAFLLILNKKLKKSISSSIVLVFSILYIIGTTILILSYRGGNLYSLNRFIYATPFIVVLLNYFFQKYTFSWKHFWLLFLLTELVWLLFNSYNHIHNFLMFSTVTFYFLILLLTKHQNKILSNICFCLLILINSIGFVKLIERYLSGIWVG